jgi:hypothetical protein
MVTTLYYDAKTCIIREDFITRNYNPLNPPSSILFHTSSCRKLNLPFPPLSPGCTRVRRVAKAASLSGCLCPQLILDSRPDF